MNITLDRLSLALNIDNGKTSQGRRLRRVERRPIETSPPVVHYHAFSNSFKWSGMSTGVMWSETVGLRTRRVWNQKKSVFVLVLQVWCCVVKHGLVTLVVIMILKDTTFQVLCIYSFSILCLEHHYCGDLQQWRSITLKWNPSSAFVYFWWSWSCYFGLGLKNLVLFTSLHMGPIFCPVFHCAWSRPADSCS